MDKEKVKEIFGEYWDGIKDKSLWNLSNKEFENIAYKQVAEELKQGDYKPHIQLKAVEKAKGNKEVIESLYIQFRVSEVTDELKAIASDYEAELIGSKKVEEIAKQKEKDLAVELEFSKIAEEITQSREDNIDEVIIDAYDYMKPKENDKKARFKIIIIALPLAIVAAMIIIYVLLT
jgi:hypothetical protein